ncbi:MAG TPA: hypothetical protein VHD90_24805 [Phototrophicaceae bacterium]|nr:hypothetical protein [Phototrophicaceae bacterium]
MRVRTVITILGVLVIVLALAAVVASFLRPQAANPAYTTAVDFVQAAGKGNDAKAVSLLDKNMLNYVVAHCPNQNVSECIKAYTPADWGSLVSAIFRRAAPNGSNWDVEVIANYQQGEGASGVCSLIHVANESGSWLVSGWSGFIHCGGDLTTQNKAP